MYELIKITEKCYYIDCPAKIGVVRTDNNSVIFIDSGSDKDAAKKALKAVGEEALIPKAIYNTHSHADHIGGNRFLTEKLGISAYAPKTEWALANYTLLEPSYLWGAAPPNELKCKFLLAESSNTLALSNSALPDGISAIDLPGHYFDMVGYLTDDGVFYIADSLSSEQTIQKYGLTFIYDVGKYLDTLELLKHSTASVFVPSHAPVTDDIVPLANYNIAKVNEIAERVLDYTKTPIGFDDMLSRIFEDYSLRMDTKQYSLIGATLKAYISYLESLGRIKIEPFGSRLFFRKT